MFTGTPRSLKAAYCDSTYSLPLYRYSPTFESGPSPAAVSAPAMRAARSSNSAHVRVVSPLLTAGTSGISSAIDSQMVAKCISMRPTVGEPPVRTRTVGVTWLACRRSMQDRRSDVAVAPSRRAPWSRVLRAVAGRSSTVAPSRRRRIRAADPSDRVRVDRQHRTRRLSPVVDDSSIGSVRIARFVDVDTDDLPHALAAAGRDHRVVRRRRGAVRAIRCRCRRVEEGGQLTWSATTPDAIATLSFADDGVRGHDHRRRATRTRSCPRRARRT